MTRWFTILLLVLLSSLLLGEATADPPASASRVPRATGSDEDETGVIERAVALTDIPPAARRVILEQACDHELQELEEVIVGDETYYEAEWLEEGMEVEIVVTPEGEIVRREVEAPDDEDENDEDPDDK